MTKLQNKLMNKLFIKIKIADNLGGISIMPIKSTSYAFYVVAINLFSINLQLFTAFLSHSCIS
jgi:hypothetical protein